MLSLHGSRSGQHAPNKLRLSKPNRVRAGKSRLFLAPLSLQLPGVSTRGRGKEILSTQVATYTTRPTPPIRTPARPKRRIMTPCFPFMAVDPDNMLPTSYACLGFSSNYRVYPPEGEEK
ncbi:hypothetical protein TSAR_005544 [Trichomalopsis sarcophagae]|uniref:Uncharacterized protein n=1 Tax=Trichomalopsis sarcophagae TaxID=543379 RepID=A0A232FI57_9HYME|nr:hypothetical protein TSAR_005544 [Trichomalopsis sarcophagae]